MSLYCTTLLQHSAMFNPLNAKLNPICHLLALLGAHPILHISRIRVNVILLINESVNRSALYQIAAYF